MYGVAGAPVYHGIWSYASLLEYTIRRARMGAEIEAALRWKASEEESKRWKNGAQGDVFPRAGRQKDGSNIREPT